MKFKIGISIGDINGIGAEVAIKAVLDASSQDSVPVFLSPPSILEFYKSRLDLTFSIHPLSEYSPSNTNTLYYDWLESENGDIHPELGKISASAGSIAMKSIQQGIDACLSGELSALVTAPISKESVNLAGFSIPGHTEFLASQTKTDEVLMMLVSGSLRVSLITTHIPISKVAEKISESLILKKLTILNKSLKNDFGIDSPKIAVFGLNPHAGDGGFIGKEEVETVGPALQKAKESGIQVSGPFAADGFFGQKLHTKFDAILAMYHDQGLVPFKALSFGSGVNFTAGLPIIRTSPDHGTAFDIAGKGIANPSSFKEAYLLAEKLSKKRVQIQ